MRFCRSSASVREVLAPRLLQKSAELQGMVIG